MFMYVPRSQTVATPFFIKLSECILRHWTLYVIYYNPAQSILGRVTTIW